jgi:hypothetical protein
MVPAPKHRARLSCAAARPSVVSLAKRLEELERTVLNTPRLHRKDLLLRYGISECTLHRWIRKGKLPKSVRISGPLWTIASLELAEKAGQIPPPNSA